MLCHSHIVVAVSGGKPLMGSVVHVFLIVKSGKARMDSCPVSGYGVTFLRRNHSCSLAACTIGNESRKCVH